MEKDPVCGMDVEDEEVCSEYHGKLYCFCDTACKEEFERDPRKYSDL